MSGEEKEAINFIKQLKEFSIILTSYQFCNGKFWFNEEDKAKIDMVLNYINKLQKENEELKEKIKEYEIGMLKE